MDNWVQYSLGQILSYEQPTEYIVKSAEYNENYKTPVLTAGKSFILGYTNEEQGIYDRLPVIIFDDFTTASQYVNFKFKVKSSAMKILTANSDLVLPKFIFYRMQMIEFDASIHRRYWLQHYSKIKVRIPSMGEQERIVEHIEKLFSQLDNSVNELKKIKEQLKVYRQAVLKEAFGLERAEQIVKLSELVEDIRVGPFGTALHKHDYISDGIPVINPQHIKKNRICPNRNVTISADKAVELSTYCLRENDIIIGRRGEMGRSAAVMKEETGWICGTGSILIRLKKDFKASFYAKVLSSPEVVRYLEDHAIGTTMKNLNESIVKNIPVPYMSLKQQHIILNDLDEKLAVCDKGEKIVDIILLQTEILRQSILKKVFEEEAKCRQLPIG